MGCATSTPQVQDDKKATIPNVYESFDQVQDALRKQGLESSNMIIGIDFTKSNEWSGKDSYYGLNLHSLNGKVLNPYEEVMTVIGQTLTYFDEDKLIHTYGFGDATTRDEHVFSFFPHDQPIFELKNVVSRYRQIAPNLTLSGPTSFAPIIRRALDVVHESENRFHILLIIADGQISQECMKDSIDAIVEASSYPLSIIMVGVGDGPWDEMKGFDDRIPQRQFDNFQFVNYTKEMQKLGQYDVEKRQATFALHSLMEVPEQYKIIKNLGLLGKRDPAQIFRNNDFPALEPPQEIIKNEQEKGEGVMMAPQKPESIEPKDIPNV
eukprot:TRINITY_DN1826_c0_g1_i1.p1 TRINITY_DN1826_c0_g1~~TRINITY_DN1826_c0_g1_i1.p1  ORF type:complete len:323 (-),score=41.31 TRINITY_DN1826_c0_g1_i1:516-1484(-)